MAATQFHFYEDIFKNLTDSLNTYISDTATSIISAITPAATTLLTIYVLLWGWAMLRGMIQEPIMDGVTRIVKLVFICAITLNIGQYNAALSNNLWGAPDELASYVASGHSDSVSNIQFLDDLMSKCYDLGNAYWNQSRKTTFPDFGLLIAAILTWLAGLVTTSFCAFLLALAKMALAILLGVGPLFVLLLIFDGTKRFFEAWIGQCLNYVFMVMLAAATIKLILSILEKYLGANTANLSNPGIAQILPAIAVCVIGLLVLWQVPSIASALSGGVAISTLGAPGAMLRRAGRVARGLRPTNIQRAKRGVARDFRITANAGRSVARAPSAVYRKITGQNKNRISRSA